MSVPTVGRVGLGHRPTVYHLGLFWLSIREVPKLGGSVWARGTPSPYPACHDKGSWTDRSEWPGYGLKEPRRT